MVKKEIKNIAEAILEKKGEGTVCLDLRRIGGAIADYFVLCDAQSTTQVCAIADNIVDRLIEKNKLKPLRMQGTENGFWVIIDYGDIVVHVFQKEQRDFYRLEDLWADAKKTCFKDETPEER